MIICFLTYFDLLWLSFFVPTAPYTIPRGIRDVEVCAGVVDGRFADRSGTYGRERHNDQSRLHQDKNWGQANRRAQLTQCTDRRASPII